METMTTPDENYPFDDIKIKTPKALQGGTYCANLQINDGPILIQTPKCKTKNGIHKTAKQIYCDLILNEDHSVFLEWIDKLQETVRNLIFKNGSTWFHETPTIDEIEYNWNDSVRSRREYELLRTFVHKPKGINKMSLQVYDSDENQLTIEQVTNDKNVICILEIIGLKFSSNSFHLEIGLRQMMVMIDKPIFNKCLIKLNSKFENGEKNIENNTNPENLVKNNTENEKITEIQEAVETTESQELVEIPESQESVETPEKKESVETEETLNTQVLDNLVDNNTNKEEESVIKENEQQQSLKSIEIANEEKVEKIEEEQLKPLEKKNDLEEIELNVSEEEPMKLKDPTEVYLDIYKVAREKAKKAKNEAIKAYLEVKRIKELYMLDVVDSSSDDEDEEEEEELFSEN